MSGSNQSLSDTEHSRTSPSDSTLGADIAKGAVWMLAMRFTVRGLGLVSMAILARLLVPEDFGLVALATLTLGLIEVFSEFSFEAYLIQNRKAERAHFDTAWTLNIIRGSVIGVVLVLIAEPVSAFFDEPRINVLLYWLALGAAIQGFTNIGVVNFLRYLDFKKDFTFMVMPRVGTFLVTIPLAFIWRDYWALIAGIVSGTVLRTLLSYSFQPFRPRLSLEKWQETFKFTKWLLINNIARYLSTRGGDIFVGRLVGAHALGIYAIAYEISNVATSELIAPISRALFPGFARASHDMTSLRTLYLNTYRVIFLVSAPIVVGLALVAEPVVRLLLGPEWLEAIPLIQTLVVFGAFNTLAAASGPIYLALSRPHLQTVWLGIDLLLLFPLLLWLVPAHGAIGAAIAVVIARGASLLCDIVMIIRLLRLQFTDHIACIWRSSGAAAVMAAAVLLINGLWESHLSILDAAAHLATAGVIGGACYIFAYLFIWRISGKPDGAERAIASFFAKFFTERFRWRPSE